MLIGETVNWIPRRSHVMSCHVIGGVFCRHRRRTRRVVAGLGTNLRLLSSNRSTPCCCYYRPWWLRGCVDWAAVDSVDEQVSASSVANVGYLLAGYCFLIGRKSNSPNFAKVLRFGIKPVQPGNQKRIQLLRHKYTTIWPFQNTQHCPLVYNILPALSR